LPARSAPERNAAFDRVEAFRSAIDELIGRIDAGGDLEADQLALPMHLMAILDAAETSLRCAGERVVVRPDWSAPTARWRAMRAGRARG
jgi:hypothetical protein